MLSVFTDAVVTRQTDLFDSCVRLAYTAGAHLSDLLTAVDIARALAEIPAPVVARAAAAAHAWQWMAARRAEPRRDLVRQTA